MAGKPWFAPKKIGYGAVPISWEGWALVLGFIGLDLILAWLLVVRPASAHDISVTNIAIFLIAIMALAAILIVVSKAKTAGSWQWRSGKDEPR